MSKKGYVLLASIIDGLSTITSKKDVALAFSRTLNNEAKLHHRVFSQKLFLEACGIFEVME